MVGRTLEDAAGEASRLAGGGPRPSVSEGLPVEHPEQAADDE